MRRSCALVALLVATAVAAAAPIAAHADAPPTLARWDFAFPYGGEVPENSRFKLAGFDVAGLPDDFVRDVKLARAGGTLVPATVTLTRGAEGAIFVDVVPTAPLEPGELFVIASFSTCYDINFCNNEGAYTIATVQVVAGADLVAPEPASFGGEQRYHFEDCGGGSTLHVAAAYAVSLGAAGLLHIEDSFGDRDYYVIGQGGGELTYNVACGQLDGLDTTTRLTFIDAAGNASPVAERRLQIACADAPLQENPGCAEDGGGCAVVAPGAENASGEGASVALLAVGCLVMLGLTWSRSRRTSPCRPRRRR